MVILEHVFQEPASGLRSILLSGNSVHPTFSACFRNTDLLSTEIVSKISLRKKINQYDDALITTARLDKFVRRMY